MTAQPPLVLPQLLPGQLQWDASALVLGVDPGLDGGLALLTQGGEFIAVEDMPTAQEGGQRIVSSAGVARVVREWRPRRAVVEKVWSRPKEGVSSAFKFGYGAGIVEGVCSALDVPCKFVRPADWKAAMKVTATKRSSLVMAQRLWPAAAGRFALVKHDGRAEACLIALYGSGRLMGLGVAA